MHALELWCGVDVPIPIWASGRPPTHFDQRAGWKSQAVNVCHPNLVGTDFHHTHSFFFDIAPSGPLQGTHLLWPR